jgi:hypothetical protein
MAYIRSFRRFFLGCALSLLAVGSVQALAQEGEGASESPAELRAEAQSALAEIQSFVEVMASDLGDAESDRATARLECLTGKLSSTRTLNEVSQVANEEMEAALQAGEVERARHEFRKIGVALERSRQYSAEAQNCLGERGASTGVTQVDIVGLGDDRDDTEPLDDGSGALGVDPPDATPFE